MIQYKLKVPFNPIIEQLLICCDSQYYSIDPTGEIWATFSPLQKGAFEYAAQFNFHMKVSMERINI